MMYRLSIISIMFMVSIYSLGVAGAVVIDDLPPYLYHDVVEVPARGFETIEFSLGDEDTAVISMVIYESGGGFSDIDITIIGPDGKIIKPTSRVNGYFSYSLASYMRGKYTIQLDNRFSILTSKYIDVAIATYTGPEVRVVTETVTREVTRTSTVTETVTETKVETQTETVTETATETEIETVTETRTLTETVTQTETETERETVTRTETVTETVTPEVSAVEQILNPQTLAIIVLLVALVIALLRR